MSVPYKVNSTRAPKLSPVVNTGRRQQQTIYNCQQVTFWPYILVALWMVPVLCYNFWDLINSRNERRARSIIRDQTLTAAGLIHVYALHARPGHEVGEKMRNTVKEKELLDIYEDIDTHVQHNDDDVYWNAAMTLAEPPGSPYSSPYTPEWNPEWSTSPPESPAVMQTHPSALSPQLSPSSLGSPSLPASPTRMATRRQRLFRRGTSSDGMAEPLLESEHHEYYDSEGIPLSTWSGRRRR
ncbi:hypothetical protein SAICODRAFT_29468 [Saitoella complicata NRRL Y-17804]|nr:uncharacterized protein SAICODRAFT_29468 [Saitoella complicata NRRL Y-17804]ODQ54291.1 hypothetical protein SAICODRAFT_29468 [Saitoella complicata NRRL Y-17804]